MAKPHKMPDNPQQSSPFNKKKHKNNDPAKLHTKSTPTAQQTRKILMSDGVNCSIWMPFAQFMTKYLGVNDQGFEFSEKKAKAVRDAFIDVLGLTPGPDGRMVKENGSLTEKEWSKAWKIISEDKTLPVELCPGFILNLSEDERDPDDTTKLRVDGSLISKVDKDRMTHGQSNWSLQRLPIEFKRGGTPYDPFDDNPKHKHESDAVDRRNVYGQLMSYAQRVFVHQHRKHLIFLFVNGPEFRIMFFDHGGVITTEAIDYVATVEGTAALLVFLRAFNQLDVSRQGVDTTVALLPPTSCGYKRMDELKKAHPRDFSHQARFIDDTSTIPESLLDSSDPAETDNTIDYGNPAQDPCQGRLCHHKYPEVCPVFTYVRDAFRGSLAKDVPRYMVKVGDRRYLIGSCVIDPPTCLVGRGTKGYVALEWETQRFVFLKDTWRSYYVGIRSEGDILQELNKNDVRNVPTFISHGDVEDQETETTNYSPVTGEKKVEVCAPYVESVKMKKAAKRRAGTKVGRMKPNPKNAAASTQGTPADSSGGSKDGRGKKRTVDDRATEDNYQQGEGLRHLIHYRLVVKEVCLPLTKITSSKQLVIIMIDSIAAHETAYKRCNLVHRDASFGNILICPKVKVKKEDHRKESKIKYAVVWKGLLTDWELAKDWTITRAMQPERTGTWHFMSRHILTHADQIVTIPDELESFVHVLIYAAVRLVDHNISDIRGFINYYFDGYVLTDDGYGCPAGKRICIAEATLNNSEKDILFCAENTVPKDHPLNNLVHALLVLIRTRYTVLEWESRTASQSDKRVSSSPTPSPDMTMQCESYSDLDSDTEEDAESVAGNMDVDPGNEVVPESTADGRTQRPPSPPTLASAKSLEKHRTVRRLLQKYVDSCTWPANDTVRDRLEKYTPRPRESLSEAEQVTRKKPRTKARSQPAAASSSKTRGRDTTSRVTGKKMRSVESLSSRDDQDTGSSSHRPAATGSYSGGARPLTRSTSRHQNGNTGLDAPQAGPSNPPGGPSGRPGGSVGKDKRKAPQTYGRKSNRGGRR